MLRCDRINRNITGKGNDGGVPFRRPKRNRKGQFLLRLLGWRCLMLFASVGDGTDLSDAPDKLMLRIWRYAPRRCWFSPLFGSYLHASRSGCYVDRDCCGIDVTSRARSVRVRAKLGRTQPLPAHGSVRLRSRHRPIGPGARTGQPSQTLMLTQIGKIYKRYKSCPFCFSFRR